MNTEIACGPAYDEVRRSKKTKRQRNDVFLFFPQKDSQSIPSF